MIDLCFVFKPGMEAGAQRMPGFLKSLSCGYACMFVCVCVLIYGPRCQYNYCIMHGYNPSNKMHPQLQPKKTKVSNEYATKRILCAVYY